MTRWSDLFNQRHLISRAFFTTPGTTTITAPSNAAYVRVSAVGAGGTSTTQQRTFGGGAAFARATLPCTPGTQFSVQVGDPFSASGVGNANGDSKVTRVNDSVVICQAARGGNTQGLASNCIGDIKRDGSPAPDPSSHAGDSAGDDGDTYALGFGGRGAKWNTIVPGWTDGAGPGGGGAGSFLTFNTTDNNWSLAGGNGRVCVEFYDQNPGLGA